VKQNCSREKKRHKEDFSARADRLQQIISYLYMFYLCNMKKWILIWICLLPLFAAAQPPAGYYDSATGLTGLTLKTALYEIINGHTIISYNNLYSAYVTTDNLPTNKVWDMYSVKADGTADYWYTNTSSSADQCGSYSGEGDCYNREHSTPASWFNDASPMYSDLFNVYPTDGYVNNRRSNYPFGEVGTATYTSSNGSKVGPCSVTGYTGTVFEPIDSFKGDFARTYFYMATRYENIVSSWPSYSTECAVAYAGNGGLVFKPWYVTMLLSWCTLDPVSTKEIDRNNAVYALQNNRNPYIDHPEWILDIWGPCVGEDMSFQQQVSVFPVPANETINIQYTTTERPEQVYLCDLQGRVVLQATAETIIKTGDLPSGFYFLKFQFENGVSEKEFVIMH